MEFNSKLMEDVEKVFALTEARVVVACQVLKETQGFRYWNKAGQKEQAPRLVCLTVKRSKTRGFKGTLHVCKPVTGGSTPYVIRSSWSLKNLISVEAAVAEANRPAALTLNFDNDRARPYAFYSDNQRLCFIAILREVCRIHEDFSLPVLGMNPNIVTEWWNKHSSEVISNLRDFAAEMLETGLESESEGRSPGSSPAALVSPKEERDLGALLEVFALGLGDVEDFEQRLNAEHAALEAANIHAILEGTPAVERIMGRLKASMNLLDDLDQNLQVFDLKLRHMREDIAAIEARNNMLEMEARNNGKLLTTLRGLLERLRMEPEAVSVLESGGFDKANLPYVLEAAWCLHTTLEQLDPESATGLGQDLHNMRAVKDQKMKLKQLGSIFVVRATEHLDHSFRRTTDAVLRTMVASATVAAAPQLESINSRIRAWCNDYAPVLEVMHALQPGSLRSFQVLYCQTMNSIIRRRLHAFTSGLRAAVKVTLNQSGGDVDIIKKPAGDGTPKSAFEFVLGKREAAGGSQPSEEDSLDFGGQGGPNSFKEGESPQGSNRLVAMGDVVELGTELHEAYQSLVESVVPMLLDEAAFAADFLILYKGTKMEVPRASTLETTEGDSAMNKSGVRGPKQELTQEGKAALESLLAGVESEFFSLVDLTGKSAQLMCLPMLATTIQWMDRIANEVVGWRMYGLLQDVQQKVRDNFNVFMQQRVAAIDRYEGRSRSNVKNLHVLPFVANFAVLAHRVEMLLTIVDDGSGLDRQESLPAKSVEPTSPSSSGSQELASSVDRGGPVRKEVDLAYMRIVGSMFATLERIAATNPKHGDRLRLENYAYFEESARPLVRHVQALQKFCEQAVTNLDEAMQRYVQQQLEYGRLWKIFEFSIKIEEHIRDVGTADVPFQAGFSSQDLRALLSSTMTSTDKKLASMYSRVKKHLGDAAPKLLYRVWSKVEERVLHRYARLEEQMSVCYPSLQLNPSPEELKELFKTTGPGS
ncbi:hypothetical protein BSKO_08662 [Bryopsis sp. KO-2023]|nr:hypothetical protein BSKO_08662 [Bryopsis sp. KO-2023]